MNTSYARRLMLFGATLVAAGVLSAAQSSSNHVSEIAVPNRANANPTIAARSRFAAVVWGASTPDGRTDIYAAASRDSGRAFGPPVRVNTDETAASLSGEQPPRIALIPDAGREPAVVVVWTAKSPRGTRLWSARSRDFGRTFAAPAALPGSDAAGNRGWESVATGADGRVVAVWLDHRELAASKPGAPPMDHAQHEHGADHASADGAARAQLSKLYFGALGEVTSAHPVTGGVCYCCKTAIASDGRDGVYAAWRHVYDGNIRDIAFTKSADGGRTFAASVRVSDDNWVLNGCPENGPALAVDPRNRVHVVWPTLIPADGSSKEPTPALFYAMSEDGRHFTARQRVPTEGFARHPQIALGADGGVILTWDEQATGTRRVAVARGTIDRTGAARFVRQVIAEGTPAMYPSIATASDATIVVWTSGNAGQTVLRSLSLTN